MKNVNKLFLTILFLGCVSYSSKAQTYTLGNNNYLKFASSSDNNWRLGKSSSDNCITLYGFGYSSAPDRRFKIVNSNDGSEIFSVKFYSGNVGIGTSSPYAKFQVNAEGDPDNSEWSSTNGFQIYGTDQCLYMGVSTSERVSYIQSVDRGTGSSNLVLNARGGNVGIHTKNPSAKLDVNGDIRCEAITVIQDVPSSDFVFEKDYILMSIEDVENFINKNKHLPEIPSALEFKENGYSVGEMDNLLLQKVEELTLYIIQMEKRINDLEQENDNLKTTKKLN